MVELSCIVLAGGKSVRMGRDKRYIEISGGTFFDVAIEKAKKVSSDVIVSLGDENQLPEALEGVSIVIDEEKDQGPLFGLIPSLRRCRKDYVALLPVDAPLLNTAVYGLMVEEIEKDANLEAVVPRSLYGPEPLFGVYLTTVFLSACRQTVERGDERVMDAVSQLNKVRFLDLELFRGIDPKLLSFHNINTPSDLERLMEKIDDKKRA